MKILALIITYCSISLIFSTVHAQAGNDTLFIRAKVRSMGNYVKIRWAPEKFNLWKAGIQHGYTIERRTMQRNGKLLSMHQQAATKRVLQKGLRAKPPAYWQNRIDTSELVGIAAATLYGEDLELMDFTDGEYLKMYQVSQQEAAQFGFGLFAADQSYSLAEDMGLAFTDSLVVPGETYLYRIFLNHKIPAFVVQPGIATGSIEDREALPALYPPDAIFTDQQVKIRWNQEDFQTFYTSYEVERSDDFGLHFQKINELPIVATMTPGMDSRYIFYEDILPENFKPFLYRIRGKSIFDEFGPYSSTIQGKGLPGPLSIQMGISGVTEIEAGSLLISWQFPDSLNHRLEGFDLFKSANKEGPFEQLNPSIIPPHERAFKDSQAKGTNYYKIKAIDIYGHSYHSFSVLGQLSDEIPPSPPTGLAAKINKKGEVQLHWTPNLEDDIMAYRVFMANSIEGNYAQLTAQYTVDTFYNFEVSMDVLNKNLFCKVIALDYRENYSDFSLPIEIIRPDVIPPIAPLIKKIRPTDKGVLLQWISSESEDVDYHLVQHKAAFESNWTTLLQFQGDESFTSLLDSTVDKRFEYQYRVLAIDQAGLKSSSKIFKSKTLDKGERTPIQSFEVEIDRKNKRIILSWIYPRVSDLFEFVLYRSKGDDDLRTYKQLNLSSQDVSVDFLPIGAHFNFSDNQLNMDTQYTYQLLAKHKDGGYSPLSDLIQIQY